MQDNLNYTIQVHNDICFGATEIQMREKKLMAIAHTLKTSKTLINLMSFFYFSFENFDILLNKI